MCDATRLQQIVTNISNNGLQYTSAGGSVVLRFELIGTQVLPQPTSDVPLAWIMSPRTSNSEQEKVSIRISIQDTGIGMSEAEVS
jgi:signal transduction histidine kinase